MREHAVNTIRNFRDVADGVNAVMGMQTLRANRLYRSGSLDQADPDHLPKLSTVVNLRRTPDPVIERVSQLQVAPTETMNNYVFESEVYRDWISRVFETVAFRADYPILLHCEAGKDRTGVAVALVLKGIDIPDDAIVNEYMRGDGKRYPESLRNLLEQSKRLPYLQPSSEQKTQLVEALLN